MASTKRRYSKEDFGRRGDALVESKVSPNRTAADEDKFVAIDIETGEYKLDKNEMKAAEDLAQRQQHAAPYPRRMRNGAFLNGTRTGIPQKSRGIA